MKNYTNKAEQNLANYARLLEDEGCSNEQAFHYLLEEFKGTPYVWGEETTEGSDCSGTVCAALNALFDTNIRVTADALYRIYFTLVVEDDKGIQAAFFLNKDGKAVHIAGYMGHGLFMNESSIEENGGTSRTINELKRMYSQFACVTRKLQEEKWV